MGEAKRRGTFEERRALSPGMQHQVLLVAENGSDLPEPMAVLQELIDMETGRPVQRTFRGSLEDAQALAKDLRRANPRGVYEVKGPEKVRHVRSVRAKDDYRAPPAVKSGRRPRLRRPSQHKEIISYMRVASFDAVGNQARRIRQAKEHGRLEGLTINDLQKLTRQEEKAKKQAPLPQRAWLALWKFQSGATQKTDVHTPRNHKLPTPLSRQAAHGRRAAAHIAANPLRAARAKRKAAVAVAITQWGEAIAKGAT